MAQISEKDGFRTLTLTRPDDWHVHLRDGGMLKRVMPDMARRFGRAIAMPNLTPPVTTCSQAGQYRERILAAVPAGMSFEPLMVLYLTDNTPASEISTARDSGFVQAVKWYPAGATTNSQHGVTDIRKCAAVLEAMQEHGVPLLVHGEVTDKNVDVFDREKVFIEKLLLPLSNQYPRLRIVLEHITTRDAVEFVKGSGEHVGATITAHHLLLNRNALFTGGIRPHHYCLPVLKRELHRQALVAAASSGNAKFFLGTDSAPHLKHAKESACGCAGIYTAHAGIELYAEAFEDAGALEKLEGFASFFGPDFYRLPRNKQQITLQKQSWSVPEQYGEGENGLVPLRAGDVIGWTLR